MNLGEHPPGGSASGVLGASGQLRPDQIVGLLDHQAGTRERLVELTAEVAVRSGARPPSHSH